MRLHIGNSLRPDCSSLGPYILARHGQPPDRDLPSWMGLDSMVGINFQVSAARDMVDCDRLRAILPSVLSYSQLAEPIPSKVVQAFLLPTVAWSMRELGLPCSAMIGD